MDIYSYISDPHKRIQSTHFLVVIIIFFNIIVFTDVLFSIVLQVVLIIAIILHNYDDIGIKKSLEEFQVELEEDKKIFDKNIIISEFDLLGNITYVNTNFCTISGYSEEELLGKPHSMLDDSNESKDFSDSLWKTIQNGETFQGVIKNIAKDGHPFWNDTSIIPIIVKHKTIGYKAIRFDITEKILSKEVYKKEISQKDDLLDAQKDRFEFAINSSRDGFWDLDIKDNIFYISSGWKKRLGFKEDEELSYLDYLNLIPQSHRIIHHEAIHNVIDDYENELNYVHFRIKYPLITKSGEKLLIDDVGDAFFDKNKALLRITGFHRDVSEEERQAKMIESQNRVAAMGDMIGNIAHQWRQPIGAINNALNDLEFDIELEDLEEIKASKFLEISSKVKEYTHYLSNTIDDFRSLSSDEKEKSTFQIKNVLEEAYDIINDEYKRYAIHFSIHASSGTLCEIHAYKRELLQIIINILNNAKDIISEKEISEPKVSISLENDENSIYIYIRDNAGGIPDSIIDKIFDPYFTTKHESIGTGIGLFMSKKMIQEHFNGTLEAINEEEGATFIISLPMCI